MASNKPPYAVQAAMAIMARDNDRFAKVMQMAVDASKQHLTHGGQELMDKMIRLTAAITIVADQDKMGGGNG